MVIPAMKVPSGFALPNWLSVIRETCEAFISLGFGKVSLIGPRQIAGIAEYFEKHLNFEFIQLDYEPKGALATVCRGLAESELFGGFVAICPADTLVREALIEKVAQSGIEDADCTVVVFRPQAEAHARSWSYVHCIDGDLGKLTLITEGPPATDLATTGIFLFRNVDTFMQAARWCFLNHTAQDGQYYASAAVNFMLTTNQKVKVVQVDSNSFTKQEPEGGSDERYA